MQNVDLQKEINKAEQDIILVGIAQVGRGFKKITHAITCFVTIKQTICYTFQAITNPHPLSWLFPNPGLDRKFYRKFISSTFVLGIDELLILITIIKWPFRFPCRLDEKYNKFLRPSLLALLSINKLF